MNPLARTLDLIEYAPAVTFASLAMIPLLRRHAPPPPYVTLDEALPTGRFRVTEVSDAGSVPELRAQNDLDVPVLLLDGEELVGAKQNRVVNLTILVPARASLTIPVSCVEAGRWRPTSPEFTASGRAHFREGRAHKLAQVSLSLGMGASPMADQSDVWARISDRVHRTGTTAPTSAMHDIYESQRHSLDEFVAALTPVEDQAGAAFAIGGTLAGVEVFDSPVTMRRLLAKIVGSYALDAIVAPPAGDAHAFEPGVVRQWSSALATTSPRVHESVGLGQALRWTDRATTAAALTLDGAVVHFVAFPLEASAGVPGTPRSRMRAASWRRANRG